MNILSFSENLKATLREKLADLKLQEEDLVRVGNTVALAVANEVVKKYVADAFANTQTGTFKSRLTWTASKAALVELIYALHYSKVIDEGSSDVKSLATAMEQMFNVNLGGNYYRVLQDIRLRKSNQTAFLDQLKQKLVHRLDNSED